MLRASGPLVIFVFQYSVVNKSGLLQYTYYTLKSVICQYTFLRLWGILLCVDVRQFRVHNRCMVIEKKEEDKDMITVPEAAQEASLNETTIRNAIYRGRLNATNSYGRLLIKREDFEAYRSNTKMGRPKGTGKKQEAGGEPGQEGTAGA